MNSLPLARRLPSVCLAAALLSLTAATLSAQPLTQQIPDGAAVEVTRNGNSRRGVVRGYAAWGEYRVEYEDGGGPPEWVPAAQVRPLADTAPAAAPAGPPDLAPLYQALGAACGTVVCCIVPVGFLLSVILMKRRK